MTGCSQHPHARGVCFDRFPTGSPDVCLPQVVDYFRSWQAEHGEQIAAIGYGTFGPCDPNPG